MSERMTNTDIEDVLSSIRRLVSEEARYQFRSERKASPPEPEGKLMLTPDFRVVPDEGAEDLAAEPVKEPVAEFRRATPESVVSPALRDRVAVLEAAVSERDGEYEPDGSEVVPSSYLSQPLPEPDEPAEAEAPQGEATPSEPETKPEAEAKPVAETESPAQAEPEALAVPKAFVRHEPSVANVPEEPADNLGGADHAAVRENPGMEWEDQEQTVPRFAHRQEQGAAPTVFDETPAEELDEEALREMIRDIIREELQGTLGERITRNVRKLVRAEVSRALAGRDFG